VLSGHGTPSPLKVCKVPMDKDFGLDFGLAVCVRDFTDWLRGESLRLVAGRNLYL